MGDGRVCDEADTHSPTASSAGVRVGVRRRKVRKTEREWEEERGMERLKDENGEIEEEAVSVPRDL